MAQNHGLPKIFFSSHAALFLRQRFIFLLLQTMSQAAACVIQLLRRLVVLLSAYFVEFTHF